METFTIFIISLIADGMQIDYFVEGNLGNNSDEGFLARNFVGLNFVFFFVLMVRILG
jgi:hypothetical protein